MRIEKGRIFNHRDGMSELRRFEMSLPKWMDNGFEHAFKTECIKDAPCHNCKLHEALTIAMEALEKVDNETAKYKEDTKYSISISAVDGVSEALRRIEALGR